MTRRKPKIISLEMGAEVAVEVNGEIKYFKCSGTNTKTLTPEQVIKNIQDCIKSAGTSRKSRKK